MKTIGIILAIILSVFAMSGSAHSQCGTYGYSYTNYGYSTYYPQTYVQQVVVPVYTPTVLAVSPLNFLYLGGYNVSPALVSATSVQATATTVQQPATVIPQTVPQSGKSGQLSKQQLDMLLDALEQRLKERQGQQLYQGTPPPIPMPQTKITSELQPVSFHNQAEENHATILWQHCSECHTGRTSKGGFTLFTDGGEFHPTWSAQKVWDAIQGGRMPPKNRARIDGQQLQRLKKDFGLTS